MRKQVKAEFKRITFPTKQAVVKNTAFVLCTSIIASTILSLLNGGITELIHLIIK